MDLCSLTFRAFGLRISLILLLASVSIYLSFISLFFHSNISQVYCRIDISTTSSSFVASISSGATVPGYILPSIWDLNVPQHCTPYSELAYASVSTYPPVCLQNSAVVSSIDFFLLAAIHRMQVNKVIIRTILPGSCTIDHGYQWPAYSIPTVLASRASSTGLNGSSCCPA